MGLRQGILTVAKAARVRAGGASDASPSRNSGITAEPTQATSKSAAARWVAEKKAV